MKLRCLLVDDEPPALKVLQSHIANVSGLEIVALCKTAVEAMDVLHEKQVDVIFLDIKMPKITGTEFLKNLSHPPKVIFVTAYREYALESYELDAVDYLVKPVSFERFLKAVSKVKRLMGQEIISHTEDYKTNPDAFVYLKVDKSMLKILINEILYIEGWKDYVKVFMTTGKSWLVKQSISSMENLLSEHKFLRIHRSYIISLNKVTGYNNLSVQLDRKEIPIGRLYKQHVIEVIQST
ncbi:MAG TPA: LytTR family DNA-binding domain-containing protein [Chitinophagaceae bacterium]|jgi:DNA-binding LytR/AlgR family response regulator|nr:LytTR family DNA-binding domain-containing protein [Chitinophagaceae bacterium]